MSLKIQANTFIMTECNMKPLARFGGNTAVMTVLAPSGNTLGVYDPITREFQPTAHWNLTWSPELIALTEVKILAQPMQALYKRN